MTVKLGFSLAQTISQASVEWSVPGLREGQISELLRALPKTLRRELMPFPPKVAEIARDLRPTGESLKKDLAQFIRQRYGVEIPPDSWPADAVPAHLRPRIEVVDHDHKTMGTSRNLNQLRRRLDQAKVEPTGEDPAWGRFALQWEQFGLTGWTFGDLPERITVSEAGKVPLYAWPGIQEEEPQSVSLRLYRSQEAARRASLGGCRRLVSLALQKDLAWLHKDLRALSRFAPLTTGWRTAEELSEAAFENLRRHLLPGEAFPALTEAAFKAAVEQARAGLPGLAAQMADRLGVILKLRQDVLLRCKGGTGFQPVQSRAGGEAQGHHQFKTPGRAGGDPGGEPLGGGVESIVAGEFSGNHPVRPAPANPALSQGAAPAPGTGGAQPGERPGTRPATRPLGGRPAKIHDRPAVIGGRPPLAGGVPVDDRGVQGLVHSPRNSGRHSRFPRSGWSSNWRS